MVLKHDILLLDVQTIHTLSYNTYKFYIYVPTSFPLCENWPLSGQLPIYVQRQILYHNFNIATIPKSPVFAINKFLEVFFMYFIVYTHMTK